MDQNRKLSKEERNTKMGVTGHQKKMQIKTILRFYICHNDCYQENGTANGSVIKITREA